MSTRMFRVDLTEELLLQVEKPARYTGNEWNAVYKDARGGVSVRARTECKPREDAGDNDAEDTNGVSGRAGLTRFAFCFPDTYEVGMSHIGLRILYDVINKRPDAVCERAFAPWIDMERLMRERGIPLFALESRDALAAFDFIGFTLQYELCYTNVLNMLDLAGLDPLAANRGDSFPIVIAGGPCVCNPAPMEPFVDLFVAGEGEEVIDELLDLYGAGAFAKRDFLRESSKIEGVYVPLFPPPAGQKIKKRIVADFDSVSFPEKGVVPNTEIVHDRITLELFRGCIRGCRFCQAGYIYRPVRAKTPETLLSQAEALVCSTGYEEISLSSLSTSDYEGLEDLTSQLAARMSDKKVNLSLPSLRVDSFSLGLAENASNVRKSGLTFAPEAGTQRLRDVINKGICEDDLLRSAELAFNAGWGGVKLYFMIGLPTETDGDLDGIADLVRKIIGVYRNTPKELRARDLNINVSASSFVPKPFTPFQWAAQDDAGTLRRKQEYLRGALRMKHVKFNWHDARESFLEAVFARGGRGTGDALYEAWKNGAKFDGWNECFRFDIWMDAFGKTGVDPSYYANRHIGLDEPLPWDIMDYGIDREFLKNELNRANEARVTENCRESCSVCGIARTFGCGLCGE